MLVLCMHVSEAMVRYPLARGGATWLHALSSGLDFGRAGVALFFSVSGYVVPPSLRTPGLRGAARFVLQRAARLYPAFWLSIVPGAWSAFWLWGKPFTPRELWLNATMLPQTFGARPALWPYWTLRVEWIFYALCIILHLAGLLHSTRIRLSIMLACALLFVHGSMSEIAGTPGFFAGIARPHMVGFVSLFFYGAWVREAGLQHRASRLYAWGMCGLLPALGLALAHCPLMSCTELIKLCVAYPAGVALFVFGLWWLRPAASWLSWLGVRSYGLYLFHAVVLNVALWASEQPFGVWIRHCSLLVDVALVALISTAIAHLVHTYVERPCVALAKRWIPSASSSSLSHSMRP